MTNDQEKARIRICEAMGKCTAGFPKHKELKWNTWSGGDCLECGRNLHYQFDPFTDAGDCEALIQWLQGLGWQIEIHWQHTSDPEMAAGAWIHIWQHGTEIHHRTDYDADRWKQGIVELALKILEDSSGD